MKTVKFTAMKDGTREDYEFLTEHEIDYAAKTADRLLDALVQLDEGLVRLQDHAARPFAAGGDPRLPRWCGRRLDRLRAAARHRRHLRALQSRRIRRRDPEAVRARAMHLGGREARRFPAAVLRASSRRQSARSGQVCRPRLFRRLRPVLRALGPVELRSRLRHAAARHLPALRARSLCTQGLRSGGDPRRDPCGARRSRNSQSQRVSE